MTDLPTTTWAHSLRRITALIRREILAVWRDKRTRLILILPPIMQLFVFSYAASYDLHEAPIAIYNEDMGLASRELIARFTASDAFEPVLRVTTSHEIPPLIEAERALAVLHIGPTFSRDLATNHTPTIQLVIDGRQSNTALVALSYVNGIIEDFSLEQASRNSSPAARQQVVPRLITRAWFNPSLDSKWYIVPGLVSVLALIITMMVSALSIARERELGTFEQLLVTPLTPFELLIGKLVPPALLGFGEGLLLAVLGVIIFHIPIRGDILVLVLGMVIFLVSATSIGLMISTFATTQQQAMIASFCTTMPLSILSGLATPLDNMPGWLGILTYANPLRYALILSRGIFLQDMPLATAFANIWPMAIIGAVTATLAANMFRRRVA
ncbi:MAG: ABC transporter permease [Rhodospirillaceae bacterium]|nr:MAG: ABC transporter permease [Rhodospirillaceae bacterium]